VGEIVFNQLNLTGRGDAREIETIYERHQELLWRQERRLGAGQRGQTDPARRPDGALPQLVSRRAKLGPGTQPIGK